MTNTAPYGRPEAAQASPKADFDFIINRIIGKHRTVTLVQVVAVRDENGNGEPDAGCVDLKPLVMAKDPHGKLYSHGTIYNVPFFIGGLLNGEPQQYIKFTSKGIEIHSPTAVTINTPTLTFNGDDMIVNAAKSVTTQTQTITTTAQTITVNAQQAFNVVSPLSAYNGRVSFNGIFFDTHKHQDVQPGKGLTGLPSA